MHHKKNLYHERVKGISEVRELEGVGAEGDGGGLQLSMQCLSEDGVSLWRTGREWMSVAWSGRSDISTPTVCHSAFPNDVWTLYGTARPAEPVNTTTPRNATARQWETVTLVME